MTSIETDFNQAVTCHQAGEIHNAEELYRKILTTAPVHTPTLNMLAVLLHKKGDSSGGLSLLTQSLQENPNQFIAENNMGIILKDLGQFDEARTCFQSALQIQPGYVDAHYNLANTYLAMGNPVSALDHYQLVLEQTPNHVNARVNLGNLYLKQNDTDKAITVLTQAIAIDPENASAYNNLGLALEAAKNPKGALLCYQKALAINPQAIDSYNNLGNLHTAMGQSEIAARCFEAAIKIDPKRAGSHYNYSRLLQQIGRLNDAITANRKALELNPARSDAHSNLIFTMQYNTASRPEEIAQCARNWAHALPAFPRSTPLANTPVPSRPLKIGYLSGDFLNHPVGYFLTPVLENHDPAAVDIYGYSNTPPGLEDDLTSRFRGLTGHWRDISCLNDDDAAEQIESDQIDILVDLSGHTGRNRLPLLARRLAPVQVGWIGSCATTGLETMDYLLVDEQVVPVDEEELFSETIWRLPQNYLCFSPPPFDVPIRPAPPRKNTGITFGCYNNVAKVTDQTLALWARILSTHADSQLHFRGKAYQDAAIRERLKERFSLVGIESSRISFKGGQERAEFLASYNDIDIALDPFPFGGGASTAEALWMGVPVVSLRSDRWAGRVSESLLKAIGQPDLVAPTQDAYVDIACALADDTSRLGALHQNLRARLESSSVCNGPAFTIQLETAFRQMWHKWCASQTA